MQQYARQTKPRRTALEFEKRFADLVCFPMRCKPNWLWERLKRSAEDCLLGAVEHIRVVDNADARLDVVRRMPWESAPGCAAQSKVQPWPMVDRNGSIFKIGDGSIHTLGVLFKRFGADDNSCIEGAPNALVDELDGFSQIVLGGVGGNACLSHQAAKRLGCKTHFIDGIGVNITNQCPRQTL